MSKLIVRGISPSKIPVIIMMVLVLVGFAPLQHAHGASMTLVISPTTASFGDAVEASGLMITGNGEVRVYLQGLLIASAISDRTGYYNVKFLVPAVPCNTYLMIAIDVTSNTTAYASLSIKPRISVAPAGGSFNDEITVRGYGFAASNNVTLRLEGLVIHPLPSSITDPLGSFEVSFQVPATPNGTYIVRAADKLGNTAGTFFTVIPKIVTRPVSAPSGTFVFVDGCGFAANSDLMIMFNVIDITPYSHAKVGADGSFSVSFFVPEVQDGIYSISASDTLGNVAAAPFLVPSPIITLSPDTISGSFLVTVDGLGFHPDSLVMLYFEDTLVSGNRSIAQGRGDTIPDEYGSFEYSFIVPTNAPGKYQIAAYQAPYSFPSELEEVATATLTIVDKTCLDIEATAGSIHFRGELSEFYIKTSFNGDLVDVYFNQATTYCSNGTFSQDLLSDVTHISTGFYRIPYTIEQDASPGTYSLLIKARYWTDLVDASGVTSASFLISPTLTSQVAHVLNIDNDMATIVVPDLGAIRANLTAIDARLIALDGRFTTIQSDLGTLRADVETINATLLNIAGNLATVQSDLGTLKTDVSAINATLVSIMGTEAKIQTSLGILTTDADAIHAKVTSIDDGVATVESDIGTLKVRVAEAGSQTNATSMFALAAALASISAVAMIIFTRKTPRTPPTTTAPQPPEPPPDESSKIATTQTKETQESTTTTEAIPQSETPGEKPQEAPTQTQTEKPSEKPKEESPQPDTTPPPPSNSADQSTPPESSPKIEPKPQDQPTSVEQQPEPEVIVVQPENQPPQQN